MTAWRTIESAPKDGRLILLLCKHASPSWPVVLARWQEHCLRNEAGWKGPKANFAPDGAFTHWSAIPDFPQPP